MGSQRVRHKRGTPTHTKTYCIGQGTLLNTLLIYMGKEYKKGKIYVHVGFPGGSVVKKLPAQQETWVQSLGWEDLLEKEMATHSSILAWEIPWAEEPGRLQSVELLRVRHN